jgi:hypothetical protein
MLTGCLQLDGHYLNLPVMNEGGEIVGMVDVLKLTYATLEQINTMSSGDGEGPAWNKFWLSLDHETESVVSGDGSHHHTHPGPRSLISPDMTRSERINESVAPGDSASHAGANSPAHSIVTGSPELPPADIPFAFKFKAPSGRVHRIQVTASQGIGAFVDNVTAKLGAEVETIGGAPAVDDGKIVSGGYALSYLDDEGDSVSITTDQDLLEAILLARQGGREKVDLFVHDPEKSPVAAPAPIPEPVALPTPPASSVMRERRRALDDDEEYDEEEDEEEEDMRPRRGGRKMRTAQQPADQVIAGVPNELLLPGAIVTLAVVIVGVFAISRASSR